MKIGFAFASVCIPFFNIVIIILAKLTDLSDLIAGIISVVGTIGLSILIYNIALRPYLDKITLLEMTVSDLRRLDKTRSDFIYTSSIALKDPTYKLQDSIRDLDDLDISSAIEELSVERELKSYEHDNPYFRKKVQEDKKEKIAKNKYRKEVIENRLREARSETQRIVKLVDDMMELSDLDSKKLVAQNGKVNVEAGIHDVIHDLMNLIDEKDLEIVLDMEEGVYIEGAEERFKAMMKHLIDNALRYSSHKGIIWINSLNVEGHVIVSIKDEGVGISEEDQKHIFDRFFRVKTLNDQNPMGTGLGLAIVKQLAQLMDAEIKVKSAYGKGSTFSVVFKRGL